MFVSNRRYWPSRFGDQPDIEDLLDVVEYWTSDKPLTDLQRREIRAARNGLLKSMRKVRGFMDVDPDFDPWYGNNDPEHELRNGWLQEVIRYAYCIGTLCPIPHETQAKMRGVRKERPEPWWHKPALARATELQKKHPTYRLNRLAGLVFAELEKQPNGPPSEAAVLKCL
jgi:hypothetical protein